jgi:anti-anti-sigma factor
VFTVDASQEDDRVSLRCAGELDVAGCPRLIDAFDRVLCKGLTQAVVDLRDVTFVDSTGLGGLLHGALKADSLGARFTVVAGAHTRDFLESTALAQRPGAIKEA